MIIQPTKLFGTFEYMQYGFIRNGVTKKDSEILCHLKEKEKKRVNALKQVIISSKTVLFKAFGQIYNSEMEYRGTGPFVRNLYVQVQSVL